MNKVRYLVKDITTGISYVIVLEKFETIWEYLSAHPNVYVIKKCNCDNYFELFY